MTEQEHYSLRWNNHQNHMVQSFDALFESKALVDVTLVCSDTSIAAHKVVLSACSPFFERIFAETPCKHPVIVLKDFNGSIINTIMSFMYRGHINVEQEQFTTLMQAGKSLQVRGLVDNRLSENRSVARNNHFLEQPDGSPISPTFGDPLLLHIPNPVHPYHLDRSTHSNNAEVSETCTSPMPRRKQARPRRRSGECGPHDLTRKNSTPLPATLTDIENDKNEEEAPKTVKEKSKDAEEEERPESSLDDETENDLNNEMDQELENEQEQENDIEQDQEHDQDNDVDEPNEDNDSSEVPEDLCTKNSLNNNSENLNNNNNRIVLSLKDIRHLNRPSGICRPHPHSGPPNHSDFAHPNNHSVVMQSENMKREALEGRLESDNPFLDQMDLTLAAHHHNMQLQNVRHEMENNMHKEYTPSSPMSLPSHFNPRDGLPHPPSPLQFPGMPSALTLTPPHHMFGLDSPLGFLPPGMDPAKLYNPLMEMSDPRGMHPDHHGPFLKKKMSRPKGQHSAPRGGPPRSWTNAELTEALQHVWNKKMTTSQASRIFGIPYNSLLMYVRGKYGKSLKLEQLRKDCISGPPIELLTMGMSAHNNNNKMDRNKEMKELDGGPAQRSSSSEPDLLSSPNAMFNPFQPGFYPDFSAGFPALPLNIMNFLPPDRHQPSMHMPMDEDCKSDRSKQSLDDDFPPPLALNRDERREILQQNGQD